MRDGIGNDSIVTATDAGDEVQHVMFSFSLRIF